VTGLVAILQAWRAWLANGVVEIFCGAKMPENGIVRDYIYTKKLK